MFCPYSYSWGLPALANQGGNERKLGYCCSFCSLCGTFDRARPSCPLIHILVFCVERTTAHASRSTRLNIFGQARMMCWKATYLSWLTKSWFLVLFSNSRSRLRNEINQKIDLSRRRQTKHSFTNKTNGSKRVVGA